MKRTAPIDVCILATPDTVATPLIGIHDLLNAIPDLHALEPAVPPEAPYRTRLVSSEGLRVTTASGLAIDAHATIDQVDRTDVVIVPSIMLDPASWKRGRNAKLTGWLAAMHDRGAMLCATCSGVFLLAETGLLDGKEATMHWSHARTFAAAFPEVRLDLKKMLVTGGGRGEIVMSGASTSWQDLLLYLITRQVGEPTAHTVAKFFALQWHADGQAPFMMFVPYLDHGDPVVLAMQDWAETHHSVASPVEEMITMSGLPARTFKRRFEKATGLSPIKYIQALRVEKAKRWLERSTLPVDEIGWKVGYEDPAFFRRLFKRVSGMPPGRYRAAFSLPQTAVL